LIAAQLGALIFIRSLEHLKLRGEHPMRRTPTLPMILLAIALPTGLAFAQEKQHVSYKTTAETSKYTQQLNLNAADIPNHVVRAFELHRVPTNPPVIGGVKLVEDTNWGLTDLVDGNGSATVYSVYAMENGDKFFARANLVIENSGGKLTATQVGGITGGTGKLAGIQGSTLVVTHFDIHSGFNEAQTDIEYAIK
jgi:hypothetical protein